MEHGGTVSGCSEVVGDGASDCDGVSSEGNGDVDGHNSARSWSISERQAKRLLGANVPLPVQSDGSSVIAKVVEEGCDVGRDARTCTVRVVVSWITVMRSMCSHVGKADVARPDGRETVMLGGRATGTEILVGELARFTSTTACSNSGPDIGFQPFLIAIPIRHHVHEHFETREAPECGTFGPREDTHVVGIPEFQEGAKPAIRGNRFPDQAERRGIVVRIGGVRQAGKINERLQGDSTLGARRDHRNLPMRGSHPEHHVPSVKQGGFVIPHPINAPVP